MQKIKKKSLYGRSYTVTIRPNAAVWNLQVNPGVSTTKSCKRQKKKISFIVTLKVKLILKFEKLPKRSIKMLGFIQSLSKIEIFVKKKNFYLKKSKFLLKNHFFCQKSKFFWKKTNCYWKKKSKFLLQKSIFLFKKSLFLSKLQFKTLTFQLSKINFKIRKIAQKIHKNTRCHSRLWKIPIIEYFPFFQKK